MNAVQSHLSTNGIWDRDHDDFRLTTFSSVLRYQAKITKSSIEEEQSKVPKKPIDRYIKEHLQPAIDTLVRREERRRKAILDKAQEVTATEKRKREETELEMNKKLAQEATEARKRKREEDEETEQDMNGKLDAVMSELHTLRDTVDKEMGRIHSRVRRKFRKVERKILDTRDGFARQPQRRWQ